MRVTLVMLVALGLGSACSSGVSSTTKGTVDAAAPEPSLAYLLLEPRTEISRWDNVRVAYRRCMEAKGFVAFSIGNTKPAAGDADVRTGLDPTRPPSLSWASEYGYGISNRPDYPDTKNDPISEYLARISADARTAWLNRHKTCTNKSIADEFADLPGLEANQVLFGIEGRVQADEAVVATEPRWASCMADAGFRFANHGEAYESAKKRYTEAHVVLGGPESPELAGLRRAERALAVADQRCYEGHVLDVEARVRARYERAAIEENDWLVEYVDRARQHYEEEHARRD